MCRNLIVELVYLKSELVPGLRSQNPAGEGANPARVCAALHHGRRAARVPQQVPDGAGHACLPGGPVLAQVVAEVPEGEGYVHASAEDAGTGPLAKAFLSKKQRMKPVSTHS